MKSVYYVVFAEDELGSKENYCIVSNKEYAEKIVEHLNKEEKYLYKFKPIFMLDDVIDSFK